MIDGTGFCMVICIIIGKEKKEVCDVLRNPFRDMDAKNLRRSSDLLKKQNDYQKIVNKRLNIAAIVTVLLFMVIAVRLIDIQVRQQDDYTTKLESYSMKKQVTSTPRGQMLDRNGNLIVKTVNSMNITYYPTEHATVDEQWELAMQFAKQFKVSGENLTFRDLQDAYITLHTDEKGYNDQANHLLSEEELKLSNDEIYQLKLSRINEAMINEEMNDETKAAWVVYSAMEVNSQSSHSRVILEGVDDDQVAYLTEHKSDYPGFDVDFSSWSREYPYENTFKDVIGQVTTSKQGLPSELMQYYTAKGYEMNARVGRSGLEQQYEDLLSGTSKVSTIKYDEDGTPIFTEVNPGKKGYDLQLTIDIKLQQKIDQILKTVLERHANNANRVDMNQLYVSLMNPNTGEIYAMSGQTRLDGDIVNYASGNYIVDYTPGSVVKGATVYMGLTEGVVTKNDTFNDSVAIQIQGTPAISSYSAHGWVNAVNALAVSSNIYMVNVALRLAGATYIPNGPLIVDDPASVYKKMRGYYSMFGLGVLTGLDIPNEQLGFRGSTGDAGNLLYFSFGQYDNYTPIQLLQYAATVANGGTKVEPRLVSGAYGVNSTSLVYTNNVEVLSTLPGAKDNIQTVQEGFRACVTTGNCGAKMRSSKYSIAAKTGTAEVTIEGGKASTNASMIGYWPYEKPEVAFVCSAPTSSNTTTGSSRLQTNICYDEIMPEVINAFYGE